MLMFNRNATRDPLVNFILSNPIYFNPFLESDNDLKARFAVSYVPHLRDKPLIYVTFTGSSTVKDDHKNNFSITKSSSKMHNLSCKTRVNKKDCKAGLLVAKEATEGTVLAILSGTHRHQRVS